MISYGRGTDLRLENKDDLDEIILVTQLTENLDIDRRRLGVEEVLIIDYLSSSPNFNQQVEVSDLAEYFSNFYDEFGRDEALQGRTPLSRNPLSKMAHIALRSRFESDISKRLLSIAETKEEYLQTTLFNYIFSRLSDGRKLKLENLERDIPSSTEKAASIYINQSLVEPYTRLNLEIVSFIEDLDGKLISISDIERRNNILRQLPPEITKESDEELFELQQERKGYLETLANSLEEKVNNKRDEFRLDEEKARNIYETVESRDLPTKIEIGNLSSSYNNLRHALRFLEVAGDRGSALYGAASRTASDIKSLKNDHDMWKRNFQGLGKREEDIYAKREQFETYLEGRKYVKCFNLIDEVDEIRQKSKKHSSNRYLARNVTRIELARNSFYEKGKEMTDSKVIDEENSLNYFINKSNSRKRLSKLIRAPSDFFVRQMMQKKVLELKALRERLN